MRKGPLFVEGFKGFFFGGKIPHKINNSSGDDVVWCAMVGASGKRGFGGSIQPEMKFAMGFGDLGICGLKVDG